MTVVRYLFPALVGGLLWTVQLGAQEPTGSISGQVVDSASQTPLAGVAVVIVGTQRGTLTRDDGNYVLPGVPSGTHSVRARRIGYSPLTQTVSVTAGGTATLAFALPRRAAVLEGVVVTGYGTQRTEAITGSVAVVDADDANVGVIPNVNSMITGRVAGVQITQNSGDPGAGSQIRIRGGTSISASNDPLYVIDGVPIQNVNTEPGGIGIGGSPSLPRSPLNLLNPSDIESITILKDASSTAIYGSRGANGVILIQTKKGTAGGGTSIEYDTYVATSAPAEYLDLLSGDQYRQFIQQQVAEGNLDTSRLADLGQASTDWQREVTRRSYSQNHNLSFAGGSAATRYRASLNYANQEGVALTSGLKRYQGRLNGTHNAFSDRLRLGLNLTASHVKNQYLAFDNTSGFEGGVFHNMVTFNPTLPVTSTDTETGRTTFFEIGAGSQSVRNPVALAEQIDDQAKTTRTLGNVTGELDLIPGLTASVNVGVDRSEGTRRTYFPASSPFGAVFGGRARQVNIDNQALTLQSLLTYREHFATVHDVEVVGGYEFNDFSTGSFGAESRKFLTDAFSFNNLGGGGELVSPFSFREDSRLVSFFTRTNYGFSDRIFVTGVLRYDGSSRFGAGNKWALFPAVSASWRISAEDFMRNAPLSDLRLRVGWGLQGNQAVDPYSSLILLGTGGDARYGFGDEIVTGVAPTRNANPLLKWEETDQKNIGLDYGFLNDRFRGSIEYYVKNTRDLLLTVAVPQPALVADRLENIGRVRNRGVEFSMDGELYNRGPNLRWTAGLVFAAERNTVVDLGGRSFITTGGVSGEGQSGQVSQRIIPGQPLGTFFGPVFLGVDSEGKQLFKCVSDDTKCVNGQTTNQGTAQQVVIGNANPDFTVGFRSNVNWNKFDVSMLVRGESGRDVFNNTSLVYATKFKATQDQNFLASALNDPTGIREPAIYSSRWIEDGSFVRLQNLTVGYTFDVPTFIGQARNTRVYLSGDNLLLLTGYSGYDPEVHADAGLASRGIDYLSYPRPRTFTAGVRVAF
ncbi:MAG: SusC/RagA family TonB-linked outer membrane protein [Gemmatimonadaceae bacterium]